jgi:hypothetical protein
VDTPEDVEPTIVEENVETPKKKRTTKKTE